MTDHNEAYNKAKAFIQEHSKLNEAGDARTMNQKDYLKYFEEVKLIPPEQVKGVAAGDKEIINAAVMLGTSDLVPLIAEAKKNGDDPSELSTTVRISRPSGPIITEIRSERTTTNPSTGEKITHHGVSSVKVRSKGQIDPTVAQETENLISALLKS